MTKRHLLCAVAMVLLWAPGLQAADQFKPMPLQLKPAAPKDPQQKAVPRPAPPKTRDHRQPQSRVPAAKPQPQARPQVQPQGQPQARPQIQTTVPAVKPRTAPVVPRAGTAAPPAAQQVKPRPGLPSGPPPLNPGTPPAQKGTGPVGPVVITPDSTRRAPLGGDPSGPPDLMVSRIEVVSGEVRFRVSNRGPGEKKPGRVNYFLTIDYFDLSGRQTTSRSFTDAAGITSLSRLRAGFQAGEDRASRANLPIAERMRITLCINSDRRVEEANYDNNCLTRDSQQTLSDLELVSARFELYRRVAKKKKGSWLSRAGKWVWDLVTVEFDESGIPYDNIVLTIRNNGSVPVTNFEIKAGLGPSLGYFSTTYTDVLQPGQTRRATLFVASEGLWEDTSCCSGAAMVDSNERVTESDEGNNKKPITTVRIRDHRPN